MRVLLALAIIVTSVGASQQPRGEVTSLTVQNDVGIGAVRFIVRGRNPCGAVRLNYGDGNAVTHAIVDLPFSYTYDYTRVGDFAVSAEGMGNCDGVANSRIKVTAVRPQPPPPPPPDPAPATPAPSRRAMRFAAMDRNGDRVITRDEWTGSVKSFSVHDWNRDGVLSGEEVELGAQPGTPSQTQTGQFNNWSEAQFRQIDRNRDNRIVPREWPYDLEDFVRIDRNRDSVVVLNEFLLGEVDDDRGDRFDDLDLNRNNRIERREWHGSLEAFRWLDQNNDGVLSRAEVVGTGAISGSTSVPGRLENAEVLVSSRVSWTDTGITVAVGDTITIQATGEIQYSPVTRDVTAPGGVEGKPATANAPLPRINIGALIGRIGTNTAPFFVGASMGPMRSPRAGRLFLRVNDDILNDNRGEFRVSIAVTRGSAQ